MAAAPAAPLLAFGPIGWALFALVTVAAMPVTVRLLENATASVNTLFRSDPPDPLTKCPYANILEQESSKPDRLGDIVFNKPPADQPSSADRTAQPNVPSPEECPRVDWKDPTKAPVGPDGTPWEWRGPDPQGGKRGGYVNPNNPGQSVHPDLNHPEGIPPHWDYTDRGNGSWRLFPDGSVIPK
jgi:hypothetical protein